MVKLHAGLVYEYVYRFAVNVYASSANVELYLNGYHVDYYQLWGTRANGRIGLYSPREPPPQAWRPDPNHGTRPK
jgi:hypothetical protein